MPFPGEIGFILGLDLGTQSIGWCLLESGWNDEAGRWIPHRIEAMGSRIFDPGVEGDIEHGRDESRGVKRRMARGQRRTTERRAGRMHALFLELVRAGLLPQPAEKEGPLALRIHATLDQLDGALSSTLGERGKILPYELRAQALVRPLERFELGRAMYHLAQRRGFKSNRKADAKEGEDTGVVKGGIKTLREAMLTRGARTLGSHLATLDPEDHAQSPNRIRQRHKGRDMVEAEFDAIWAAQGIHHPDVLSDPLKRKLHSLIFFQRPLKSAAHLVGHCTLEPGRFIHVRRPIRSKLGATRLLPVYKAPRRAALADPACQRFRILQKVNDLRIDRRDGRSEELQEHQRAWLLAHLEERENLTFAAMGREWGLRRGDKINLAEGTQKAMPGHRTWARVEAAAPGLWEGLAPDRQDRLVQLMRLRDDANRLKSDLQLEFNLEESRASCLADTSLEPGYLGVSHLALSKLLPLMEAGLPYSTAVKQVYGTPGTSEPLTSLPRVLEALPTLRNPMVARTLTELRKVVNAILRKYGKPVAIRIELARDMKKSREARKGIAERQGKRRKEREAAAEEAKKAGISAPKARDIEKALLAKECNWVCPYTGQHFGATELFNRSSPLDIEHIIPYSRSLDDSYANKTLCFADENRHGKHDKLPMEAYGPERMEELLARVEAWPESAFKLEKLRRFRETKTDPEFISSQLNDTAMASKLAGQYLALLYGGRWDADGWRRIQNGKGQTTAILRGQWHLNPFLGGGEKNRGDHRHHALDALVIALTDPATMQVLSRASQNPWDADRLRFAPIEDPWNGFRDEARKALEGIIISRRIQRKLNGRLHDETFYGRGVDGSAHKRIKVEELDAKKVKEIVDDEVQRRVELQLKDMGQADPQKAFKDPKDHPFLEARDGRCIPIHKVRIKVTKKLVEIGEEHRLRLPEQAGNHHLAIREEVDKKGIPIWAGEVVTQREAMLRHARRPPEPVVRRGPGFVMSLREGDTVRWEKAGVEWFGVVRSVVAAESGTFIDLSRQFDARKKDDQRKDGGFFRLSLRQAKELRLQKVDIDPLGLVRTARD